MKKLMAVLMALASAVLPGFALAEEAVPLTIQESLMFMLKGMVGIFLVTGLIILVLVILEKVTKNQQND